MVIMHLTSKKKAPMYGETGLNRIRKIVEYAKELNMKIAFEDTKIKGYLEYVLDNIKDFADKIATEQILIPNAGHINSESGYDTFEDIVSYL